MSFDQRPARATKRVVTPTSASSDRSASTSEPEAPAKSGMLLIVLFVAAAMIGGGATTAVFYGLVPGIPQVVLPGIFQR